MTLSIFFLLWNFLIKFRNGFGRCGVFISGNGKKYHQAGQDPIHCSPYVQRQYIRLHKLNTITPYCIHYIHHYTIPHTLYTKLHKLYTIVQYCHTTNFIQHYTILHTLFLITPYCINYIPLYNTAYTIHIKPYCHTPYPIYHCTTLQSLYIITCIQYCIHN